MVLLTNVSYLLRHISSYVISRHIDTSMNHSLWPFVSKTGSVALMYPLDLCIPLQSFNNVLICLNITQYASVQCGSLKKTTGKRGTWATVENKIWFTLHASLTMLMWAQRVCCSRFQIPQNSYHLVNRKVHANKNKSFLCCSGPPLHNSWLCSCSVPWKTNSAVQLGSSRQQKGNFNPFFFLWHHSDLFGHKERKSTPPSEKDWEVRTQIMPDPLTCRLGNTTGQEINPQQVKVLDAQRSLINSDSDTLLG